MTGPSFGDAVAAFYEQYMVPMVFEPYAEDLVSRLSAHPMGDVLETAAGTGVVTRKLPALRDNAPKSVVATDLSQSMLDVSEKICADPLITRQQANAMALPFPDATFDLVFCQFGAMFFSDRAHAYAEARRVLRPGGRFVFSVWGRVETSEFADVALGAVIKLFPSDPPTFLTRIPHGYFDHDAIRADVATAGFAAPSLDTVNKTSHAPNAMFAARALVQGTPMRGEVEARDPKMLGPAVATAERALVERFGEGPIDGKMQAIVVTALR